VYGYPKGQAAAGGTLAIRKSTLESMGIDIILGGTMLDITFWKGKRVLVTGHTGFKGSWLCKILLSFNAEVYGYSLKPATEPNLFELLNLSKDTNSTFGDIRDFDDLYNAFKSFNPEIVIHLAAQPIVRESYKNPRYTYETNVMGTVNILECIRQSSCVRSFLNVTTDKVYENKEWVWGYRENEALNGFDPYSNSKSCSELVTDSYKNSFFADRDISISTARAGNVIGGGDNSVDRIIPDCVRAAVKGEDIFVRNPGSIRPYQHVLDPLYVYLLISYLQYTDSRYAGCYNVGPNENDCITTASLVEMFCRSWGDISWNSKCEANAVHEANFLKLDCSKVKTAFGWQPRWNIQTAVKKTVEWEKCRHLSGDLINTTEKQIKEFFGI
jgi:CDP-glucose 4,6-dehydratase